MRIESNFNKHILKKQDSHFVFELLASGDIFRIAYQHNQINLLRGNLIDGQAANIFLRIKQSNEYKALPLIGLKANAKFKVIDNKAIYQGNVFGLDYQVTLTVEKNSWYYDVLVKSNPLNLEFDLVYGQDMGINATGGILSSESYTGQYIDHAIYQNENGYIIQSRQNQGDPQFLQIGSLSKNVGYLTDGFQLYGRSYKVDEEALGLKQNLINEKYQYEFPYLTLQSHLMQTSKENKFTFYGYYEPNHETIENSELSINHQHQASDEWFLELDYHFEGLKLETLKPLALPKNYIKSNYTEIRHVEYGHQKEILSFFTKNHTHVITAEKERLVERQHGHLLISGNLISGTENNFGSTNWMFGVFASHIVLGNTNIQKFNSDIRNPLNVQKHSGLRIYIKNDDKFTILGTPSLYETGINFAKWIYILKDDTLEVTTHVKLDSYGQRITFKSLNNKKYDLVFANQLVMGSNEYERDVETLVNGNEITFTFNTNDFVQSKYPNLKYKYVSQKNVKYDDDKALLGASHKSGIVTASYENVAEVTLDIYASFDEIKPITFDFHKDHEVYAKFIDDLTGINFKHKNQQADLDQLSDTIFWYTHNALVHYASPHGLEQSNGAAWGTRDVLQGPVELFSSAQRYDLVRGILLKVFSRQFIENADFPQWFMFDKYFSIQAHESHGDIIVWPLKVLGDYIKATGDVEILKEKVAFMSMEKNDWVNHESTLQFHIEKTLNAIIKSFVPNTSLPSYGGGDWDDTLQPANKKLTDRMVSGWTPVLLYQALDTLSKELDGLPLGRRCFDLKQRLKDDYFKYFMKDNVPAGFVVFEEDHNDYLLHPSDKNTGLKYRLLPLTRSIIAQMVDKEQAKYQVELIEKHLKHPDGVRLMDTFVEYKGGKKTYFQRAETAANLGREIGIMYVHAHIRYIEAMAKVGEAKKAYEALYTINPISIQKHVKNAQIRQSNMYFSSSDAAFNDRYIAKKEFDKIKKGKVEVKGGWRLYSSGPGIYINQLISNIFGLRIEKNNLIIDPVIPAELKGLEVNYHYQERKLNIKYSNVEHISKILINGKLMENYIDVMVNDNIYRKPGFIIYKSILDQIKGEINIEFK